MHCFCFKFNCHFSRKGKYVNICLEIKVFGAKEGDKLLTYLLMAKCEDEHHVGFYGRNDLK